YVNANEVLLRHRQEWVGMLQGRPGARDPRLTRVGFFLRQSGLDELPRLFNILTRDMSLVGPKAITRREIMRYGRRRVDALTSVMPGLTGLWQLHSQKEAADERVNLELEYINNWSPWLDIKILFGTLTAVWKHQAQGAF
ncbi:sugar transferase, partial [Arthrospira platensis SPKY1]|nr:sugar transferase [Arthrospira platensis SPKY1]